MKELMRSTGSSPALAIRAPMKSRNRDYSYRRGSCVIAVPRMLTVDSVEEFKGGSWEAIPQDRYSTGLHFRQKWSSGIDTIYWDWQTVFE